MFIMVCLAIPGQAQEIQSQPEQQVEVMEELTVTATRTERVRIEVPASVTIVTKEEIAASPEKNLDEILRQKTGVDISRRQGIAVGIPARLDLRGVPGPGRTLVLVDGFPINSSGTGFVTIQQIPLEAVERVEIVRGPFSALYGANALGGVINIITKRGKGKPTLSLFGGPGTWSWHQAGAQSGGGNDKADYFIHLDNRSTRNYYYSDFELRQTFNPSQNVVLTEKVTANNRDYEDWRHVGNFRVAVGEASTIALHTRYFHNNTGLGLTENLPSNRDERVKGETILGGLTFETRPTDRVNVRLKGYVRQYTDRLWSESSFLRIPFPPIPGFAPSFFEAVYRDFQIEGQASCMLGKRHLLTGGFDFLTISADFDPVVDADTKALLPNSKGAKESINTFGFYLQDEIDLGKLQVIPGIRLDKHSLFGAVVSPKLGVSYKLSENTNLRASGGRAYRAPTMTELFRPEWNLNPFTRLGPNRDLKPEYIWAVDAGIEHRFSPNLRFSLDGFYNYMEDFIITQALPSPSPVKTIQYVNLANSWSAGLETGVEWRPVAWLTAFGNYTFLQTRDKMYQDRIQYLPDHKVNLGLRFTKKWREWLFQGSLIETFVGDRRAKEMATDQFVTLKPFALTDLALNCTYRDRIWGGLTIHNLFDRKYEETLGYLGPGRLIAFTAGVKAF
jgi:vitamin B12 transporter